MPYEYELRPARVAEGAEGDAAGAPASPSPPSPEQLLELQRTHGNVAVQRMLDAQRLVQRTATTRSRQRRHRYRTRRMTAPAHPGRRVTDRQTIVIGLGDLFDMTQAETLPPLPRTSAWGGWVEYLGITNGQRHGVRALITPSMIGQGTPARYDFQFMRRRAGLLVIRGHLLARVLGGDGNEPRNLIPLLHIANNLPMYSDIEKRIHEYVEKNHPVSFSAIPTYGRGVFPNPRSILPTSLAIQAVDVYSGLNVVTQQFDCRW